MTNNYKNIPQELKKLNCWVGWKKVINERVKKIPINPTNGEKAGTTNSLTWGTFEEALSAYQRFNLDGIGFVFTNENPYLGIDIDDCVDDNGNLNELVRDVISQVNSYTEYSQSGEGIHILCKGRIIKGKKRDGKIGIEMYSENRYFALTGNVLPGSPLGIEERSKEVEQVHEKYLGEKTKCGKEIRDQGGLEQARSLSWRNSWTEEELVEKAKRAKRGQIFEQLYHGNWQLYYKTQSEAELALANMLAFWTAKDIEMMDRIYRMSGLKRAKWDQPRGGTTYGKLVLEEAIAKCTNVYKRPKKNQGTIKNKGRRNIEKTGKINCAKEPIENSADSNISSIEINGPDPIKQGSWYQILPNGNLKFFPAILAKYLHENIPVVYADGQAYKYQDGVYSLIEDIKLDLIIKDHMRDDHATMYAIRDVRKQWMIECSRDQVEFDSPSLVHIINLKNGLYDIQQRKLFFHTPEHHSLVQLDCSYKPKSKCDKFIEFINQVLPQESVVLAQEIVGYLLVPLTEAQKSFVIFGSGGTGKSTFIRIVEAIVGKQNVSNVAWQDLTNKYLLAKLSGKLVNTFADLPDKGLKDLGMFKSLTGEDRITADIKFKDPFEFMNKARLLFSTNHLPQNLGDNGYSFYRRLVILPFENRIESDKVDTRLTEKLITEKDGIFLWALEGLARLINNGFKFSENKFTKKVLTKYQRESSSVRWFIEENCIFGSNEHVECTELYEQYRKNCLIDGIKPLDKRQFNNEVEESYGPQVFKGQEGTTRRAIWRGIKRL